MRGNVKEWVQDWYDSYSRNEVDPQGPQSGDLRVVRGGSFGLIYYAGYFRCADRHRGLPEGRFAGLGFRCARTF